ncbi:MAG: hypothetical protein U0487_01720 [Patescibacteria group bacterium]
MKRVALFCLIALTASIAMPPTGKAAVYFADNQKVTFAQPSPTSAFLAGEVIDIEQPVKGDLFCAGLRVTINAPIDGDVICAAKYLSVNAPIAGDIRAVAITTDIRNTVSGRGTIFTSALSFFTPATVQREWNVWTQKTSMPNHLVGAEYLAINHVTDDLSNVKPPSDVEWFLLRFFTAIATALALALGFSVVFPERTGLAVRAIRQKPRMAVQLGVIATITAPIISFFFLLTIVGIPIGFALLAIWVALAYSAQILAASMLGHLITHQWIHDKKLLAYFAPAVGIPLLWLVFFIPVAGWVARLIAIMVGFAGIWLTTERFIKKQVQKSP